MSDKRTYKQIARDLENYMKAQVEIFNTHMVYINNHLSNMDGHLEKINTTDLGQEVKIARNKDRISLIFKIGGGLFAVLGGGAAFVLHLLGVY